MTRCEGKGELRPQPASRPAGELRPAVTPRVLRGPRHPWVSPRQGPAQPRRAAGQEGCGGPGGGTLDLVAHKTLQPPVHQAPQPALGCPDKAAASSVVTHRRTLFLGDSLLITLIKWWQAVLLKIYFFFSCESRFLKGLCREWQNEPGAPQRWGCSWRGFPSPRPPWEERERFGLWRGTCGMAATHGSCRDEQKHPGVLALALLALSTGGSGDKRPDRRSGAKCGFSSSQELKN